jgi:hypothetical protein
MKTLKNLILNEHSKAQALVIADIVRQKPELLEELISYTFANEEPLSRRAAWPLRILGDQNPELLQDRIDEIIDRLESIKSSAVLRNILALLVRTEIPENRKTYLLNFSSQAILNPESPSAVIAHAADIFTKIAGNEIILIQELLLMLKQIEPNSSGGIKSKIKHVNMVLRKLEKVKQ